MWVFEDVLQCEGLATAKKAYEISKSLDFERDFVISKLIVRMRSACFCLTRGNTNGIIRKYTEIGADFQISDFEDFRISRFHVRFPEDFQTSVRDFKLVTNPSLQCKSAP